MGAAAISIMVPSVNVTPREVFLTPCVCCTKSRLDHNEDKTFRPFVFS